MINKYSRGKKTEFSGDDRDSLLALIVKFDAYTAQDSIDKLAIRSDIQKLSDNTLNRIGIAENVIKKYGEEKYLLEATAKETSIRLEKIEMTVYGPNKDGKGGGSERIITLGDEISTIKKWIAILSTIFTGVVVFIAYMVFELSRNTK